MRPALEDGSVSQTFTLDYGQVVPKPFCSAGPYDFVLVSGPVEFHKTVHVTRRGALFAGHSLMSSSLMRRFR